MTPKQEAFARAYVETGNASEAYRRNYECSKWTDNMLNVEACNLLKNPKVALRVSQLQAKHQERHEITVDTITEMLKADRELARTNTQSGAAVAASMGLAKLHGLIVEKATVTLKQSVEEFDDSELTNIARAGGGGIVATQVRQARSN